MLKQMCTKSQQKQKYTIIYTQYYLILQQSDLCDFITMDNTTFFLLQLLFKHNCQKERADIR